MTNSKIKNTDELLNRINKLVDFLDKNDDYHVSAGDVLNYICGNVDTNSKIEDEIETFD